MVGSDNAPSDEEVDQIWERYREQAGLGADVHWEKHRRDANNPRYEAIMHKAVRLKNGIEMDFGTARVGLLLLRELQSTEPDQFAELVRSVRPRGATQLPEPSARLARARMGLKERGFLLADGGLNSSFADVLDAAFADTKDGIVLREVVVPPSKAFVEDLIAAEREVDRQMIAAKRKIRRGDDERAL